MTIIPARILIVEDNVDNARMLQILLKAEGHEARIAFDGPAAIEAAGAERPEVVLLDLTLPGMSGIDVATALRGLPELSGCLLVAVSGHGRESLPSPSPFDHHVQKPVNPPELLRLIARTTARRAAV